ncbi:MAG: 3'(2'),5'-bisphosphate nucleotidase [Phycisphaera sp.]|nr:3'(2'),5'-bisphosphate nucleotidase [Phycisphaera sp.]
MSDGHGSGHGYEAELTAAVDAVRLASHLCRAVQAEIDDAVLQKKDRSPVTVADFGSQALVCRALQAAFPNDPVIGEEDAAALRQADNAPLLARVVDHVARLLPGATPDAEAVCGWIDRGGHSDHAARYWTLDPIDGTKGFLRADQYAIALALIVDGQLTVGAMACPNLPVDPAQPDGPRGAIFTSVAGHGAAVRPIDDADVAPTPIRVSATDAPAAACFCESFESGHSSHDDSARVAELLSITAEPVRMDSQAKYAAVARGQADIYLRLPTRADYVEKIWDHAAGAAVVTEAGGKVTDLAGRPLTFTHGRTLSDNRGVIVTNGLLHDRVLAALAQAGVK